MDHWISIADELPERNQPILAYSPKEGNTVELFEASRGFMAHLGKRTSITHWMPMPGRPSEYEEDYNGL